MVIVAATGRTAEVQPADLGTYFLLEGTWSAGHPVGRGAALHKRDS
jgi:hypothetical protein